MKSLEKQREDNRMECVKNCPPNNGSFCEKHFQIDCEFSRRIGERDMLADQASIAAPGQTTLCKTYADERHYEHMKDFFDSELSNLTIQAHMPFCSRCGKNDPDYIGFIQGAITVTSFSFCVDCRDELTLKKNAAISEKQMDWIEINEEIFPLDTPEELVYAKDQLRAAEIKSAPVYRGDPDSGNAVKTSQILFADTL